MASKNKQPDFFKPNVEPLPKPKAMPKTEQENAKQQKKADQHWLAFYKNYLLERPVILAIAIAFLLEVQPYEHLQPTYFIATRIVNREEITLKGVEAEEAHKEAVKAELLSQIEHSKECQKQRDIMANNTQVQCTQSGESAGYCRHLYLLAKAVSCPEMPDLNEGENNVEES